MAKTIKKGDAVTLKEPLDVQEVKDAAGKTFWQAVRSWKKDDKHPYTLFNSVVGIYMGMKYVPRQVGRAGVLNSAQHGFYFNGCEVFIDPELVIVVAELEKASDV